MGYSLLSQSITTTRMGWAGGPKPPLNTSFFPSWAAQAGKIDGKGFSLQLRALTEFQAKHQTQRMDSGPELALTLEIAIPSK